MNSEDREYPERIWAGHLGVLGRTWKPDLMREDEKAFCCEYVRADRHEALSGESAALLARCEELGFALGAVANEAANWAPRSIDASVKDNAVDALGRIKSIARAALSPDDGDSADDSGANTLP